MTLSRWSLERLLTWAGTVVLVVLFVPTAAYLTLTASSALERALLERGSGLGAVLSRQIVSLMLVEDSLALHEALRLAALTDSGVRYLCVQDSHGTVVAHTFEGGYPVALPQVWKQSWGQVARFRTQSESVMDIPVPILSGQLGMLHIGMSRAETAHAVSRVMWATTLVLGGAMATLLIGTRLVADRVSLPLRQLEEEVSRVPQRVLDSERLRRSGTREVESLRKCFSEMLGRLDSLKKERAATLERMIHAERLAAMGEIGAGLAHEIHNPLDGMLECMRYLESDSAKSERAAKYYPMLRDGLERIARVMRGMLGFVRSGQMVSLGPCRVAEMLESLMLMVQKQMEGRRVRLSWESPGDCVCLCDRNALVQAVLNLVLNAAEAAETNSDPQVRIEATCDDEWVYLSVEDNGPGVPAALRERIFEPFFTSRSMGKGTGLGLSVSRQLMRAVDGEVELRLQASVLGGAHFVIRLPKVRDKGDRHV